MGSSFDGDTIFRDRYTMVISCSHGFAQFV